VSYLLEISQLITLKRMPTMLTLYSGCGNARMFKTSCYYGHHLTLGKEISDVIERNGTSFVLHVPAIGPTMKAKCSSPQPYPDKAWMVSFQYGCCGRILQ
jgi:hypothetical protein